MSAQCSAPSETESPVSSAVTLDDVSSCPSLWLSAPPSSPGWRPVRWSPAIKVTLVLTRVNGVLGELHDRAQESKKNGSEASSD